MCRLNCVVPAAARKDDKGIKILYTIYLGFCFFIIANASSLQPPLMLAQWMYVFTVFQSNVGTVTAAATLA